MKPLKPSLTEPQPGYLGVELGDSLNWFKCREEFSSHLASYGSKGIYFRHHINQGDNISGFMLKTEEIIDVAPKSAFLKTDSPEITYIEPSSFWLNCILKRQLLSIFLRVSVNYNPLVDNYEESLWNPDIMHKQYTSETKLAILRFLYGFTQLNESKIPPGFFSTIQNGWVSLFGGKDMVFIKQILQSPKESRLASRELEFLWC